MFLDLFEGESVSVELLPLVREFSCFSEESEEAVVDGGGGTESVVRVDGGFSGSILVVGDGATSSLVSEVGGGVVVEVVGGKGNGKLLGVGKLGIGIGGIKVTVSGGDVVSKLSVVGTVEPVKVSALGTVKLEAGGSSEFNWSWRRI